VGADIKVQQELLRHSTIQSTMNVYTQAMSEDKRAANSVVMGKVLLRAAQFEFRGHVVEFKEVAGTLPPPVAQSEFRGHVTDSKKVAGTLPPPLAQSEISLRAG
jgi:hypothetical protein